MDGLVAGATAGARGATRSRRRTWSACPARSSCRWSPRRSPGRGTTRSWPSAWSSAAAPRTSSTSAPRPPTASTGSRSTPACAVGFGLLTCDTEEQALDRAGLDGSQRGQGLRATRGGPAHGAAPCAGSAVGSWVRRTGLGDRVRGQPCGHRGPARRLGGEGQPRAGVCRPTLAGDGFAGVARWCVRPSYRTGLVAAGQPVLLWVSGKDPRHSRPASTRSARSTGPCRRGRRAARDRRCGSARCRPRRCAPSCCSTRSWRRRRGGPDAGRQQPVVPRPGAVRRTAGGVPARPAATPRLTR